MVTQIDTKTLNEQLLQHFRLRALPVAIKYYRTEGELMAQAGIETDPNRQCVPCLAVGRAAKMGVATGITAASFNYDYCRTVHGFKPRNDKWRSAAPFVDRWNATPEASQAHHAALIPMEDMEGFAAAPLQSGLIAEPDAVVLFATPEQAFWILASLIYKDYRKLDFTFVGESTCNDAWIKTVVTGEPGVGIGSYGERSYGGLAQDELLLSLTVEQLQTAVQSAENMENGREKLCFPVTPFGLVGDISSVKNPAFEGY